MHYTHVLSLLTITSVPILPFSGSDKSPVTDSSRCKIQYFMHQIPIPQYRVIPAQALGHPGTDRLGDRVCPRPAEGGDAGHWQEGLSLPLQETKSGSWLCRGSPSPPGHRSGGGQGARACGERGAAGSPASFPVSIGRGLPVNGALCWLPGCGMSAAGAVPGESRRSANTYSSQQPRRS